MSALFSPTALVVPFENLRMTDVESVGGKNASLGEMISQLPQGVRRCGEPSGDAHAAGGELRDHFAEAGVLAANGLDIAHPQVLKRYDQGGRLEQGGHGETPGG